MRKKTKKTIPISIDRDLSDIIYRTIVNRSRYIEYLIYQDLNINNVEGIEKIII